MQSPARRYRLCSQCVIGFIAACALYARRKSDPLPAKIGWLARAMRTAFTSTSFTKPRSSARTIPSPRSRTGLTAGSWKAFASASVRGGTDFTGRALRLVQTGNLQTYAFLFVLGVAVVLWFVLENEI